MTRSLASLALLALAAVLSACDTNAPPATAEVTVGAAYDGSVFALRDAETGEVAYDYLANGATIAIEFTSADRFTASVFVPEAALIASGQTEDVDGDIRQEASGTYRQVDGALSFTFDAWVDSFLSDSGWSIDDDGGAIRYQDFEDGLQVDVVLTRG